MFEIVFYESASGRSQIDDFIKDLDQRAETDKTAKMELKQILFYLDLLAQGGKIIGTNYAKQLDGPIWELTPGNNRILFFAWTGRRFVLLHQFRKKTQKTPRREIDQAKREMTDWMRRNQK